MIEPVWPRPGLFGAKRCNTGDVALPSADSGSRLTGEADDD